VKMSRCEDAKMSRCGCKDAKMSRYEDGKI